MRLRFPVTFRSPPFASWPSCSRHRYLLSLRSAYHQSVYLMDGGGVSMFRTVEMRPVSGASIYPGAVVLAWPTSKLQPPLPLLSDLPCSPLARPICRSSG